MKRVVVLLIFVGFYSNLFAQNEIGPDGDKLKWMLLVLIILVVFFFFFNRGKTKRSDRKPFLAFRNIKTELTKSSKYYPDYLTLSVQNAGNSDVDLDRPLLAFDNFWLKRKFKLKGSNGRVFYPLYLEKGKTHVLKIDLEHFYRHDKRLRKFPKVKIYLADVKGKRLASRSVFLRKTLFKF